MKKFFLLSIVFLLALLAEAKIKVVTTLPDIAEVVSAIGGDEVEVQSLLQGHEDPHYADARPDYILKVRKADIVCSMGLELEIGWLPKVLSRSGNARVQEGGEGFCDLGKSVTPLEVPAGVINRSLGDVHPHGNPHFNLSLQKLGEAGTEVVRVLTLAAPDKKSAFQKNYASWKERLKKLQIELAAQIPQRKVMEYHKEFTYFFDSYKLESLGALEEKPGMPPSAARIAQVAQMAKANKVAVLFATSSAPHKTLERFQELSGVPFVVVPSYLQTKSESPAKSIEALQKLLVKSIP